MSEKIVELVEALNHVIKYSDSQHWDVLEEVAAELRRLHEENEAFKNRLAQAIEQMPFGDTATSFAVFVRNFK